MFVQTLRGERVRPGFENYYFLSKASVKWSCKVFKRNGRNISDLDNRNGIYVSCS